MAGMAGFEPAYDGVKGRCLNRLATSLYCRLFRLSRLVFIASTSAKVSFSFWRHRWDSNPRGELTPQQFSRLRPYDLLVYYAMWRRQWDLNPRTT